MFKKILFLSAIAVIVLITVVACKPTSTEPQVIIQTKEVKVIETKEVKVVETVEVEKVDPKEADRRKTVIFDIDSGPVTDPKLWNPFAAGGRVDQGFFQAMIEPLFVLNLESKNGEIINWLGESYKSNDDASEWTITLRDGIEWSDGEPLTADDFLFSVNMLLENPELRGAHFDDVKNVEKVDDRTLKFTLKEPDFRFVYTNFVVTSTSSFIIVPKHIWEGQDPATFTNYDPEKGWPVFSGPYLLKSGSENEFTYVRNDDWWGAKTGFVDKLPRPEKLIWVAYGSEETRTAAMARNELDSIMGINLSSFLALKQLTGSVVAWHNDLPYAWIDPCARNFQFNLTREPWNDVDMRRAINHAINRSQIIDIAYENTSSISKTWLPEYNIFTSYITSAEDAGLFQKYPIDAYNPDKTKEILESKGYVMNKDTGYYEKDGKELSMTISNFDATEMNSAVATLVEQFQAVGINATQDIEAIPQFVDKLKNAGFDTYYFFVCGPIDLWSKMDAFSTRHIPEEGKPIDSFYANNPRWNTEAAQKYSEIVAKMLDYPPGDPKLEELYIEAMKYWLSDLPLLPIAQATKLVPFNEAYWTGWPTADNPYIQPATWWQSTHIILEHLEPTH